MKMSMPIEISNFFFFKSNSVEKNPTIDILIESMNYTPQEWMREFEFLYPFGR